MVEAADQAAYPAEPALDDATGVAALDAESAALVSRVFHLFGVTALQAYDADNDRVLNATCTLAAKVAVHVQDLAVIMTR